MTDHPRKQDALFLMALGLVVIATFFRAFSASYVYWDDNVFLTENVLLKEPFWTAVRAFFTHTYHADYLPIPLTTFWIEVHFFGFNSGLQHGVNVALHVVNVALLYFYLLKLGVSKSWTRILCVLFAIHPVQTEVLMWTSSRNSYLCMLFLLLACLSALKRTNYFWLGLFYLLAFSCKSIGLLLPFLLVAADVSYRGRSFLECLKKYSPLLVVAAGAIYFRTLAYSEGVHQNFAEVALNPHRLLLVPVMALNALFLYMKMLVRPWGYTIIYPTFVLNWESVLGAVVAAAVIGLVIWRWWRTRSGDYLFFSSVILIFLLPVLQLLPRINYINDRYMYIPIIGFTGLLLALARDFAPSLSPAWRKAALAAGVAFTLSLPAFSFARSAAWVTDKALWDDTVAKNPRSVLALNNLGLAYQRAGDLEHAIDVYKRAIEIGNVDGALSNVYNNLGTIYGSPDSGPYYSVEAAAQAYEDGLKACIKIEDTFTLRFNLAIAESNLHQRDKSVKLLSDLVTQLNSLSDRKYEGLLQLTKTTLAAMEGAR